MRVEDEKGGITTIQYDSNGQVIMLTDPAGRSRKWLYDEFGRVREERDPDGNLATTPSMPDVHCPADAMRETVR
jgi:YD repeat-containing protein